MDPQADDSEDATDRIPSTCWECGTTCGSMLTVENGRVVGIAPNREHPGSRGAFCIKGIRGLLDLTYGEGRLLNPLRRIGPRGSGKFTPISWDEALGEIADGLTEVRRRHGPLAIAGAVSGAFYSRGLTMALLMRSIGSPNWMINQDLCGGCRAVSDLITGLGIYGGEDIENAACALIVGTNPQVANPIQWAALKRAKARGAKIITLDPYRTSAAEVADLWLRVRPGTDAAVGLAMINVLVREGLYDRAFVERWCYGFTPLTDRAAAWTPVRAAEISGVAAESIVTAARMYAEGPSTFVSGHGIDAMSNGVQTFRCFHSLVAISGNLDRKGGNRRIKKPAGFRTYGEILHDPAFRLPLEVERKTLGADRFPLWAGPAGWQTACHNPTTIDAMLTGKPYPVRALYVSGVNVAVTYPDTRRTTQALRELDFLAVATHTMNPTAALADIVLPKTTGLEEEEVSLQSHAPCVSYTAAAVAPAGEARCDLEIAAGLIDRLQERGALHDILLPWRSQREFNEFLLDGSGLSIDVLAKRGYATYDYQLADFERQEFRTPTGKVELYSERLSALGLDPLPDHATPGRAAQQDDSFPLLLQTGMREKSYHHSRFRDHVWARKVSPDPLVHIHPRTAETHGVCDGDWIAIETAGGPGRCHLKARVSDHPPEGVLVTGMGWWRPEAPGPEHGALDININAALSYEGPFDPISGSPDTRALPCRISPAASQTDVEAVPE